MRSQDNHILIFSTDTENSWNEVVENLKTNFVPFTRGLGVVNGFPQVKFIVNLGEYQSIDFFDRWNTVQSLARKYNQQSIMYSDNERDTVVIDNNGLVINELGKLKECNELNPEEHLNYFVFNGGYYVTDQS